MLLSCSAWLQANVMPRPTVLNAQARVLPFARAPFPQVSRPAGEREPVRIAASVRDGQNARVSAAPSQHLLPPDHHCRTLGRSHRDHASKRINMYSKRMLTLVCGAIYLAMLLETA